MTTGFPVIECSDNFHDYLFFRQINLSKSLICLIPSEVWDLTQTPIREKKQLVIISLFHIPLHFYEVYKERLLTLEKIC